MPIPKSDYEVVMDIPQWLLKKMAKVDPSPIAGGDGEGVYYVGKFSDTWAPEDLRGKEFYYIHAKAVLRPNQAEDVPCLGRTSAVDPFFADPASKAAFMLFSTMCGSQSSSHSWSGCLDPQFEGSGSCYDSATIRSVNYEHCMAYWSPVMFIFSRSPSSHADDGSIVAYSKPCPVAALTPSLSGKSETSGRVLIRAVGCDDPSNRVRYIRYTSEDRNPTSYTIAAVGIGEIQPPELGTDGIPYIWLRYPLSSSVTKSATDYYYYIYTIGLQYQ